MSALAFLAISCEKDKLDHDTTMKGVRSEIQGHWIWLHSIGGFWGEQLTPESEGYSQSLFIDDKTYTAYINDSIVYQSQYLFRKDSIHKNYGHLLFQDAEGQPLWFELTKDFIRFIEPCCDNYNHYYTKE